MRVLSREVNELDEAWRRHCEVADRDPWGQTQEYADASAAFDQAQAMVPWVVRG